MPGWTGFGATPQWGYADWESLQTPGLAGAQVVPLFLRLHDSAVPDHAALMALLNGLVAGGAFLTQAELDGIATEWPPAGPPVAGLRLVLHAPRGQIGAIMAVADVLHVGPPLPLPDQPGAADGLPAGQGLLAAGGMAPATPLLGVIDDGIAFLHARLRRGPGQSRVRAVWLQADARVVPGVSGGLIHAGRVLRAADIDALLASGEEEADIYRRKNRALLPVIHRHSTNHRVSHGAQVLDAAAGALAEGGDADDAAMRAVDVLAVQLPPAAVIDTSGRRLEPFVVQGLRWLVAEALARGGGPLVVNISLGSLGGPGDDTAFLAEWLTYEAGRYHALTGADLHVVLPYGNAHRQRLYGRACVAAGSPAALDWCLLPDDHSPSFLEIRAPAGATAGLRLRLVAPDGRVDVLDMTWAEAAQGWQVAGPAGAGPLAAVLPLAEVHHAALLLALAPSARVDAGPLAPAGRWRVEVTGADAAGVVVSFHVQRDDTPAGYRPLGRQSWLDHPLAWEWDIQTRDWIRPLEAGMPGAQMQTCVVSRLGSSAAHAGAIDPRILLVGSIKPRVGGGDDTVSSLYSAEGLDATAAPGAACAAPGAGLRQSTGPSLVALADDGSHLFGRRTSGVLSGAVQRLSGTSVAAPAVARALLRAYLAGAGSVVLNDLLKTPVPPNAPKDRLTGWGALAGQAAYTHAGELA
ncbi:hypothetical protein GEU84_003075 [Fertoebacter nigrum]|uniref:Peptidase S8/S53 domain-containing protein n=1 Tax=Fertoeibacter niger TaxID=2656921 RepID=A0A8X8KLY6_9RHOB|nr:hypothetical protein [Fertoeibacter niger]NUB43355.1 hypothetical protein [Fertoeibacter niger]